MEDPLCFEAQIQLLESKFKKEHGHAKSDLQNQTYNSFEYT